jgi:hypothetical protein
VGSGVLCWVRAEFVPGELKPTRSISIREKPMLSSEKMLHKDYDRKGSDTEKVSDREPQGAWRQHELIGGEPPVVR